MHLGAAFIHVTVAGYEIHDLIYVHGIEDEPVACDLETCVCHDLRSDSNM